MVYRVCIVWFFVSFFGTSVLLTAQAQQTGKVYIGGLVGVSLSPEVSMLGDSNDRSSVCDEYINPLFAALPECTVLNRGEGDNWTVVFDGTWGALGSAYIGYRFSSLLRAELEYVTRTATYGQRSPVLAAQGVNADKLSNELFLAEEWLGAVSMLGLFANLHLDFNMISGPFLPYAGIGVGINTARVNYGSVWSRSPAPGDIRTGRDQPNAEEIAQNLAGVASSAHDVIESSLVAFQAILGAEYSVQDNIALDFRARWILPGEFSGRIIWDPLRGHVPNLRKDGSEPVHGTMSTSDLSALVMSAGMKYYF